MNNFIDQLNSTLNAANLKSDSEIEDLKDEFFDDLEEEAIQAEQIDEGIDKISQIIRPKNEDFINARPKYNTNQQRSNHFQNYIFEEEDEDKAEETIVVQNHRKPKGEEEETENFAELTINNLGATNHMQKRIIQLEK